MTTGDRAAVNYEAGLSPGVIPSLLAYLNIVERSLHVGEQGALTDAIWSKSADTQKFE